MTKHNKAQQNCFQKSLFDSFNEYDSSNEINKKLLYQDLKYKELASRVALQVAKAEREQLAKMMDEIKLEKENGNLCYIDVALAEFSNLIKTLYDSIKRLPNTINQELGLKPNELTKVNNIIEDLLIDLSKLEVNLSTTKDIDAKCQASHQAASATKQDMINDLNN